MEEKQSRNSRFVSIPGILCLLFFAVTAIYFRAEMIAVFLFFLFLLCASSWLWSRGVLKTVEYSVEAEQSFCYAGEQLKLNMRVRNKSFFPLIWLDVILPTGTKPLVCPAEDPEVSWYLVKGAADAQTGIRERFVWLLWQQEICWDERLRTLRRGIVEIAGAGLQAGDGFGLSARETWYPFRTPVRLVIYPRLVPVTAQPFLKITQEAVARSRGQTEDITILKSSRPYQPGDPMKRINWRLLAGSGRMEVNVYETVMPGCAAFLLDLSAFRMEVEESSGQGTVKRMRLMERELEGMISLIASCMNVVAEHGISAALMIPSYGSQEAVICLPDQEETALTRCMEALAQLDYQAQDAGFPYEEFWSISHKLGNIYICTLRDDCSGLDELAQRLGRSRVRYLCWKKAVQESGEFDYLYAEDICLERTEALRPEAKEAAV